MTKRLAFYGRLSTDDKQDQTLARPSQLEACRRKAAELGGEIVCEFFDQESGAKDDRPGWTSLTQEARERQNRRFEAVVIYQTSRLSRDRVSAGLFHRELRKVGVEIHYAVGAGDPATAEGGLMIALQQAFDEYERKKLSRETKRGMRQTALQGFRCGGRAPYGYRLETTPHPVAARAKVGDVKTRLVPEPDQAAVVAEIFHLWADKSWGGKAIADHLNRPGGPPSPSHVDTKRNLHGHWAKSTIRAMLRNPTYTGRLVWNRLDFATQREAGGTARLRAQEEWVVSEVEHLPLVSDQLFAAAQERFRQRSRRNGGRNGQANYLFTGMTRCCSGHQPLAMFGRQRKGNTYMTCDYGRTYGKVAAEQIEGHGQWLSVREDALLPLVERFFAQRIFGPMRLDKLARQLSAHQKAATKTAGSTQKRLRDEIADLDRRIGLQIDALEQGVEPTLVGERIEKLRRAKEQTEIELRALAPPAGNSEAPEAANALLSRLPDLSHALHEAPRELKRQVFEAFCLQIAYDKVNRRIEISATITQAVAEALENAKDLPQEVIRVAQQDIAGAGFEPATFGLRARISIRSGEHREAAMRSTSPPSGRADTASPTSLPLKRPPPIRNRHMQVLPPRPSRDLHSRRHQPPLSFPLDHQSQHVLHRPALEARRHQLLDSVAVLDEALHYLVQHSVGGQRELLA
jgi:site-specific DNA recombinase